MKTTTTQRIVSAFASVAITFSVLAGIANYAKPQAADPLLAQAASAKVR